jgi:hypothetical protein
MKLDYWSANFPRPPMTTETPITSNRDSNLESELLHAAEEMFRELAEAERRTGGTP